MTKIAQNKDKGNNKTTGQQIAEYRQKHGLTQRQLAEELEVTPGIIRKWESNSFNPSAHVWSLFLHLVDKNTPLEDRPVEYRLQRLEDMVYSLQCKLLRLEGRR